MWYRSCGYSFIFDKGQNTKTKEDLLCSRERHYAYKTIDSFCDVLELLVQLLRLICKHRAKEKSEFGGLMVVEKLKEKTWDIISIFVVEKVSQNFNYMFVKYDDIVMDFIIFAWNL